MLLKDGTRVKISKITKYSDRYDQEYIYSEMVGTIIEHFGNYYKIRLDKKFLHLIGGWSENPSIMFSHVIPLNNKLMETE